MRALEAKAASTGGARRIDEGHQRVPRVVGLPALVPAPAGRSGAVLFGDFLPGGVMVEDPADALKGFKRLRNLKREFGGEGEYGAAR